MWLKKPDRKAKEEPPEKLGYSGYFEHDGAIAALCKDGHPDKDYGEWLEQVRKSAIDAGLDSLPRLLSGALLICSFVVIVHQSKERQHREIIAARFLAWYHNELVHARETAREASREIRG